MSDNNSKNAYLTNTELEELQIDPQKKMEIEDKYKIDPQKTLLNYFDTNNKKPVTLSPEDEKRKRLFGQIGDIGLLLVDALTLGKGGLVNKRESALTNVNKAIAQEKARDAATLADYNKRRQSAQIADEEYARQMETAKNKALKDYEDSINNANIQIRLANAKNKQHIAEKNWERANKIADDEKKRENDLKIAKIKAYANSKRNKANPNMTVFIGNKPYVLPKINQGVGNDANAMAIAILQEAAKYDTALNQKLNGDYLNRPIELNDYNIMSLLAQSDWLRQKVDGTDKTNMDIIYEALMNGTGINISSTETTPISSPEGYYGQFSIQNALKGNHNFNPYSNYEIK